LKKIALTLIWVQLFQIALFALHFSVIEHRYSATANDFVDFFNNDTEYHENLERKDGAPVISSVCCMEECSEEDCPAMHNLSKRFSNFSESDLISILTNDLFNSFEIFGRGSFHIFNLLHLAPKNSPPQ
jgi:hypothetical protein